MAELILTDEEKATETYLEWDDAAIGKFAKHLALMMKDHAKDQQGFKRIVAASAAMAIIGSLIDSNAAEATFTFSDFSHGDIPAGDWQFSVKRMEAPAT